MFLETGRLFQKEQFVVMHSQHNCMCLGNIWKIIITVFSL